MSDFMNLVETISQEAADARVIFQGEGQSIRAAGRKSPEYLAKLVEATRFVADVTEGKRPVSHLREALSTADFPVLFGDILDRQVLAAYRETPQTFRSWARVKSVRDFRPVRRMFSDGGDRGLELVDQHGEYREVDRGEGSYTYSVGKYGNTFSLSWESLINDDLDELKDQPARFGRAARRTEERFATSLIASSTGPNATFFSAGNGNRITNTLTLPGLTAGFQAMAARTDPGGEPIFNSPAILMVPPSLEIQATNLLNALILEYGSGADRVKAQNWLKGRLTLVVNRYLPIVDTTRGNTAWYLFADPAESRGAVEIGFLRGHEEPQVFMKAADAVSVAGGTADAFTGDFATDAIRYKARHVIGGTVLDNRFALASDGTVA